jgi:hypothetical protein
MPLSRREITSDIWSRRFSEETPAGFRDWRSAGADFFRNRKQIADWIVPMALPWGDASARWAKCRTALLLHLSGLWPAGPDFGPRLWFNPSGPRAFYALIQSCSHLRDIPSLSATRKTPSSSKASLIALHHATDRADAFLFDIAFQHTLAAATGIAHALSGRRVPAKLGRTTPWGS